MTKQCAIDAAVGENSMSVVVSAVWVRAVIVYTPETIEDSVVKASTWELVYAVF